MIQISKSEKPTYSSIEIFPCETTYKGSAKTSAYFSPHLKDCQTHFENSLIGRHIKGVDKQITNYNLNYCQTTIQNTKTYNFYPVKKVRQWNKDNVITDANSKFTLMDEWMIIQNLLHKEQ